MLNTVGAHILGRRSRRSDERKTRQIYYTILRKDLDAYIKDSAEHPEKYFIPVTFTSNNPGKRDPDKYYLYPHQVPEDFRPWLDDQWYDLPDVITPKDVETILDYEHESVRRWINRGWLRIIKKSDTHRKLLEKHFG